MSRRLRVFLAALVLAAGPMLLPATSADAATNNYDSGYLTISPNGIPPVGHSASAQWFQPAGTSENSSVLFWVGVGGLGSPGASTGTAADCSGGSPVYYAWYRAPGSSAVVPYGGVIGANDGI